MNTGRSAGPQATPDLERTRRGAECRDPLCFAVCDGSGSSALVARLLDEATWKSDEHPTMLEPDLPGRGLACGTAQSLLAECLAQGHEADPSGEVTFRSFRTPRRAFIVAGIAGHEPRTRETVAAASMAELAVIVVDAREGVLVQTRRDSFLVQLLGIARVVLAVDGMDRVGGDRTRFERIDAGYRELAATLGIGEVVAIPLSSPTGDNVTTPGRTMPWYTGPTLVQHLERCETEAIGREDWPLRLRVRAVHRPQPGIRACDGWLSSGRLRTGDTLCVQPAGRRTRVVRIVGNDGELAEATAGQSLTLTLADDVDIASGDLLSAAEAPAEVADRFEADLVWLGDEPLLPGRPYWLQRGAARVGASVMALKHRIDMHTLRPVPATRLQADEIGVGTLALDQPIPFDAYRDNRDTGGFVLVDRQTGRTVGAGLLHFALRRAHNIHPQALDIDKAARARLLGQRPRVVWLTGLSGAGKSTIANALERRLHAKGRATYLLDGDNVRHGLNRDLGFTDADRVENIRRVAEVARLMVDAGLIVVTAFISPFRAEREMARRLFEPGEFFEVHVDAPLEVAERRDPKGLYAKARRGDLPHFTGIDSPYEAPEAPELRLSTADTGVDECVERVLAAIEESALRQN